MAMHSPVVINLMMFEKIMERFSESEWPFFSRASVVMVCKEREREREESQRK
jgi:hypothetical protein